MKVFISVDAEGLTGITSTKELLEGGTRYDFMRRMMTHDTNAAIDGAFEGGATEIIINESHWSMDNLLLETLDPRVEVIVGSHKHLSMMEGVEGCDAAFFIGYHCKVGYSDGVANETIFGREIINIYMNDKIIGETEINAAIAGYFGVPVVLVTGDDHYCKEVMVSLGKIETIEVKKGLSRWVARCLSPDCTYNLIKQGASKAVQRAPEILPYRVNTPVTLGVEWNSTAAAHMSALCPGSRRVNARKVEFTEHNIVKAWKGFYSLLLLGRLASDEVYG